MKWFIDKKPASEKQVREYVGLILWNYHRKWQGARK